MTNDDALAGISDQVGRRVNERRRNELKISVEELAERCAEVGAPQLTVNAIYALESGRREKGTGRRRRLITVDELLALAVALRIHPVDLLVSPDAGEDDEFSVTPAVRTTAGQAREWIAGRAHLNEPHPGDILDQARLIALLPTLRANVMYGPDWISHFDHDPRVKGLLGAVLKAGPEAAFRDMREEERDARDQESRTR